MNPNHKSIGTIIMVVAMTGCGAPSKKADVVSTGFDAQETLTIATKSHETLAALQSYLADQKITAPPFDFNKYSDAGLKAYDLSVANDLAITPIDYLAKPKNGNVLTSAYRGQFWLQKSFVGLAGSLGKMLAANKNTPSGQVIATKDPGPAGAGLAKIATPTLTFIEAPKMDPDQRSFSAKINIKVTGIIEADHNILVDGKMFEHGIAVYIRTVGDQAYEKSILKNFSTVILAIPHANDMYLDFSLVAESYSLGVDSLMTGQIRNFLQSGLKGAVSGGLVGLSK